LCLTAKLSSEGKGEDCTAILKPTPVWITTHSSDSGLFTFKKASIDGFASSSISYVVKEHTKHKERLRQKYAINAITINENKRWVSMQM